MRAAGGTDAAAAVDTAGNARPAGGGAPRLLGRAPVVLASILAAALLAGSTRPVWVQALAPDLTGTEQSLAISGGDVAPAVLALALAALAAAVATSLSSRWVRVVTGPVMVLAGIGAALSAVGARQDPAAAAAGAVAEATGVVGGSVQAEATVWPLLSSGAAALVVLLGVVVLVVGGRWPRGSRHRSAALAGPARIDPGEDPAAAWDALTRGEDPSEEDDPRHAAGHS